MLLNAVDVLGTTVVVGESLDPGHGNGEPNKHPAEETGWLSLHERVLTGLCAVSHRVEGLHGGDTILIDVVAKSHYSPFVGSVVRKHDAVVGVVSLLQSVERLDFESEFNALLVSDHIRHKATLGPEPRGTLFFSHLTEEPSSEAFGEADVRSVASALDQSLLQFLEDVLPTALILVGLVDDQDERNVDWVAREVVHPEAVHHGHGNQAESHGN